WLLIVSDASPPAAGSVGCWTSVVAVGMAGASVGSSTMATASVGSTASVSTSTLPGSSVTSATPGPSPSSLGPPSRKNPATQAMSIRPSTPAMTSAVIPRPPRFFAGAAGGAAWTFTGGTGGGDEGELYHSSRSGAGGAACGVSTRARGMGDGALCHSSALSAGGGTGVGGGAGVAGTDGTALVAAYRASDSASSTAAFHAAASSPALA